MSARQTTHTINIQCTRSLYLRIRRCAEIDARPMATYLRRLIIKHCDDLNIPSMATRGGVTLEEYIASVSAEMGPREAESKWLDRPLDK